MKTSYFVFDKNTCSYKCRMSRGTGSDVFKTGYKKKYHMGRENSLYAVVTVNSDSYQSLVKTIDCLAIIIKPKWNFAVTQSKASTFSQNNPSFLSNKLKMTYSWTLKTDKRHLHKGVNSRISHLECCLNFLFWFFSVLSVVLIFYHVSFLLVFYYFVFYYHQWVIFFLGFPCYEGRPLIAYDSLYNLSKLPDMGHLFKKRSES